MTLYSKKFRLVFLVCLAAFASLGTGCASGGYKLTRDYARFVNKQNLIVRILLYIFTSVIFGVTILIDLVVFNTMDFWNGEVSQGIYNFEKDGRSYTVNHKFLEDGRKQSHIIVANENGLILQEVLMTETTDQEIEVKVDGKLKGRVKSLDSEPKVIAFSSSGKLIQSSLSN